MTQQSCCYDCYANMALLFLVPVFLVGTSSSGTYGRSIVTDEYLCVKGSKGTIFAMGDAATVEQPKALDRAKVLPCPVLPYVVLACSSLPPCIALSPCPALPLPALPCLPLCPCPARSYIAPVLSCPGPPCPNSYHPPLPGLSPACHSYPDSNNYNE